MKCQQKNGVDDTVNDAVHDVDDKRVDFLRDGHQQRVGHTPHHGRTHGKCDPIHLSFSFELCFFLGDGESLEIK